MTVDTTEIYEAVPSTENIEVQSIPDTESSAQAVNEANTETTPIANSTLADGSAVQAAEPLSRMEDIYNDVHIIMVLMLLSFCWSCMKSWRMHSLKGVKK